MVPSTPAKPRVKVILLVGLLLGVASGIALVLAIDLLDHSLRTVDEAESFLDLPALAAIPERREETVLNQVEDAIREKKFSKLPQELAEAGVIEPVRKLLHAKDAATTPRHPMIFIDDPASLQAESIRTLRTSLSLLGKQETRRTFLFASSIPEEGKTFTSLNFAHSLAQQGCGL